MAQQHIHGAIRDYCSDEQFNEVLRELQQKPLIDCTHLSIEAEPSDESDEDERSVATNAAVVVGSAAAAGLAASRVATVGLNATGFTRKGIASGSLAAARHSQIGNVAKGSLFSAAQRTGATGGFSAFGPVGIGAAILVGGSVLAAKLIGKDRKNTEKEMRRQKRKQQREEERQTRIANGTARPGIDICEKCWIKMRLRMCNQIKR